MAECRHRWNESTPKTNRYWRWSCLTGNQYDNEVPRVVPLALTNTVWPGVKFHLPRSSPSHLRQTLSVVCVHHAAILLVASCRATFCCYRGISVAAEAKSGFQSRPIIHLLRRVCHIPTQIGSGAIFVRSFRSLSSKSAHFRLHEDNTRLLCRHRPIHHRQHGSADLL